MGALIVLAVIVITIIPLIIFYVERKPQSTGRQWSIILLYVTDVLSISCGYLSILGGLGGRGPGIGGIIDPGALVLMLCVAFQFGLIIIAGVVVIFVPKTQHLSRIVGMLIPLVFGIVAIISLVNYVQ